jgi:hypothetical protein
VERRASIVLALIAGALGCATTTSYRGYTPKDRAGMAFVVKTKTGAYKVVGGPKNHVAQPTEKITWTVVNASDKDVEVEITVVKANTSGAPDSPFDEDAAGIKPHSVKVEADPEKHGKLTLKVRKKDDFVPNKVNSYDYKIIIKGDEGSALDPELDIWP